MTIILDSSKYYRLGDYVYKDFQIYKRVFGVFYSKVSNTLYSYQVAAREMHKLNGIKIDVDTSNLKRVEATNLTCGRFLVNFKKEDDYYLNDPLPAFIAPHRGRVNVMWDNGHSGIIDIKHLNVFELE